MKLINIANILFIFTIMFSCKEKASNSTANQQSIEALKIVNKPKGKLFIIGGGKRPKEMIKELLTTSNFNNEAYLVILPMASQEPDSTIYYASKQFEELGIDSKKIKGFNFEKNKENKVWLDSLKQAKIIYISGGDQVKFMDVVLNTPIYDALHEAYQNGTTIAGTSAGAAIMSEKMITGNEYKHKEYTGDFRTIEANNIEISQGMGFIKHAIIDQHFVKRMRMNRLVSIAIEHPNETAIGIDESTAIIIEGDSIKVTGLSQVIVIKNPKKNLKIKEGLLGADQLELSVKLPGSRFTF
ncbi:cyanophycinase [Siansivirga zeaxanthinifaciens CC-SAMT-1]|uniref:Cyanophycinase n=2 Tax=Siansivirga TaxID=1204360 RepID=A0A0C5WGG9_9FLAO|nr:cyanophycinase [Siansivirga zeaxanthinifaciens CC-SAMT-1]